LRCPAASARSTNCSRRGAGTRLDITRSHSACSTSRAIGTAWSSSSTMRPKAGSCPPSAGYNCWLRRARKRRWICWTKPPQPLRRAWSGKKNRCASGEGPFMNQKLLGIAGIFVILAIAFLLSTNRRAIRIRIVGAPFALQAGIAFLVLYTSWGKAAIETLSAGVANLLGYATKGTEFLFGPSESNPLAHTFAIAALPVIIFFASLVAILYYLGIIKVESLSAAANIFVGQSESPLVVRPYLAALPPSRLFTVMCVGMAGVAGTILAAYASLLGAQYLPYLLAAAFMSAPGGILMAKIIVPDDPDDTETVEDSKVDVAETF